MKRVAASLPVSAHFDLFGHDLDIEALLAAPEPLSSADEERFDDQIDDATEYLVKWRDALQNRSASGRVVLEFPIRLRRVLCNEAFLPATFLQAAGGQASASNWHSIRY